MKCNTNDSVVISLKEKKVDECLPLKEKSLAIIFSGKHSGKQGMIDSLEKGSKMASVNLGKDGKVNVLIKQIMVVQ